MKLYCDDWMKVSLTVETESIDLILTDPPYGINYVSHGGPRVTDPDIATRTRIKGDSFLQEAWFAECYRVLKTGSAAYIFCCWSQYSRMERILKSIGFRMKTTIVWDKGNCGMGDLKGDYGNQTELIFFVTKGRHILNGRRDRNLASYQRPADAHRKHPMQKPVPLLEFLIEKSSSKGELVLDPFMGSGSTGKASQNMERDFLGVEVDVAHFQTASEWLSVGC